MQFVIKAAKTVDELSTLSLSNNTLNADSRIVASINGTNNVLCQLKYEDLSTAVKYNTSSDILNDIDTNDVTRTDLSGNNPLEFEGILSNFALINDTATNTYVEEKINACLTGAATIDKLGGIQLYNDVNDLNDNQFRIQLNSSNNKAYVELNETKLNNSIKDLDSINTIKDDINTITNNINNISASINNLDIESINKTIFQVQQISSDVLDLVETNAYMFGTYTRNLYLGLDADSDALFRQLSVANILSILIVDNEIDQTRLNNLVVTYTLTSANQNSISYNVEASTYDNDNPESELTSGPITYTETNDVSALKLNSGNKLIWLYSKIYEYAFISNDIQLSDAIRFLKDDIFTTTFTYNSKDDKYEARLMFDDYALGEYNGYVFKQIKNNKDSLAQLSSGNGNFYDALVQKLSDSLTSYFVKTNDSRSSIQLNNITLKSSNFYDGTLSGNSIISNDIGSNTWSVEPWQSNNSNN